MRHTSTDDRYAREDVRTLGYDDMGDVILHLLAAIDAQLRVPPERPVLIERHFVRCPHCHDLYEVGRPCQTCAGLAVRSHRMDHRGAA